MKGKNVDIESASLIILYTVSKALAISPLEVMQMPAKMVMDFLAIHQVVEEMKADEIEKISKKMKK